MIRHRPYLDYYAGNKIMPEIRRDITNLDKHFRQRSALYHHLGVIPSLLKNKTVIEFGAGCGHNALFTLACQPRKYVFIDGDIHALKETQTCVEDFKRQKKLNTEFEFHHRLIEDYQLDEKFDLVICEGLLTMLTNPAPILRKISPCGAIVIITCSDTASFLTDVIRRVAGQSLVDFSLPVIEQSTILKPFFAPHFANLPEMNRPLADWIIDCILQPFYGNLFSIPEAIKAVDDICDVLGSSPHFITDWRWHKDIHGKRNGINQLAIDHYYKNVHNLLDHCCVFPERAISINRELLSETNLLFNDVLQYQDNHSAILLNKIIKYLQIIIHNMQTLGEVAKSTCQKLNDGANALQQIANGDKTPDFGSFISLFGRGKQHLSFVPNNRLLGFD